VASALTSAAETIRDSLSLGRRSLGTVAWILAVTALVDFGARWAMSANPIDESVALDPTRALAGVAAAELMLLDGAVLAMVSLLLLPIQDALGRGRSMGIVNASALLVRKTFSLTASSIVQGIVLFTPPTFLMVQAVAPVVRPLVESGSMADPGILAALLRTALWRAFWPSLAWVLAVTLLFLFAFPFLILDDRGPVRSIGLSASLFVRSVPREWPRMLAVLALWGCLLAIVSAPIGAIRAAAGGLHGGLRAGAILGAAWGAATSALSIVWIDAGLVTLFRKLAPTGA
jgi:hypothetical protein